MAAGADGKMKTGIALGGGGAKGFAHIGVLGAFSAAGIEFDMVSGTSIGALVGAVYAAGKLPHLEDISLRYRFKDIPFLLGPTWPARGLFSGNYVERLLNKIVNIEKIEDLGKPFAAVAVDVNRAETVTFTSGSLCTAVHASMAIPGLFTPVLLGDKLLVDGGVLEPVPVKVLKELGADIVVAVDLLSNFSEDCVMADFSIVDIVQRSSIIAQKRLTEYSFGECPPDIVISPCLIHVKVLDFHRGRSIIEVGRQAAEAAIPELRRLLSGQERGAERPA